MNDTVVHEISGPYMALRESNLVHKLENKKLFSVASVMEITKHITDAFFKFPG